MATSSLALLYDSDHDSDPDAASEMWLQLKFNEKSMVRPWRIPNGLAFCAISPPSNQPQYLDIGVLFSLNQFLHREASTAHTTVPVEEKHHHATELWSSRLAEW